MAPGQAHKQHKRIIVCCDGTWMNSDNGYDEKTKSLNVPSNVTRFARAVASESKDGIPQITYYQAGVGSSNNWWDQMTGGATGEGLDEHIREAYAFIAHNWNEGDEIFLVGFSRGAFTARSIAGMIDTVGLLTSSGMSNFYRIFKDYENMHNPNYSNPVPGLEVPKNILPIGSGDNQKKYFQYLKTCLKKSNGDPDPLTSAEIPKITAIGVWDTVGSLGIPGIWWVDRIKRMLHMNVAQDELKFYDTKLSTNVLHAFQALALDEMRYSFQPAVWEKPAGLTTKLKQVWFPGVHSNIGGGETDPELADITLAWMMSQMHGLLDFNEDYVESQFLGLAQRTNPQYRPWSCGNIDTTQNNWIYKIAGTHHVRTPGQFCEIDPDTGAAVCNPKPNGPVQPLENTQERVHSSIRVRLARNGLGINDNKAGYEAEALTPQPVRFLGGQPRHGWQVEKIKASDDVELAAEMQADFPAEDEARFIWRSLASDSTESKFPKVMIEDVLGVYERLLVGQDPELTDQVFETLPVRFA